MAGKRKSSADRWLPPRVYRGKSAYEWRPEGGGAIRLCKLPADGTENEPVKREVWRAFDKARSSDDYQSTVNTLINAYFASPQFDRLSNNTQSDYRIYQKKVRAVFGRMVPRAVTPGHIRKFMDKVGAKYPVSANRHHSFLSTIFGWAYERDIVLKNPATGVRKFPEKPRERYVEDWEFDLVYEIARESSYPYIAAMMEIAYLCRMRSAEIRALKESDHILADGIFVERGKGSKNEITAWSPRLRAAIAFARTIYPDAPITEGEPVFHNRLGQPLLKSSYSTAWGRVINTAMNKGLSIEGQVIKLKERFHFHDIKAKGITDHETKAGGHRSKKMEAVYDRKPEIIKATR